MLERRKFFELKRRILPLAAGLAAMESVFFHRNGCPRCLAFGNGRDHGPKTDRIRPRSVPVNVLATPKVGHPDVVGYADSRGA
jgi:hypothetical protein